MAKPAPAPEDGPWAGTLLLIGVGAWLGLSALTALGHMLLVEESALSAESTLPLAAAAVGAVVLLAYAAHLRLGPTMLVFAAAALTTGGFVVAEAVRSYGSGARWHFDYALGYTWLWIAVPAAAVFVADRFGFSRRRLAWATLPAAAGSIGTVALYLFVTLPRQAIKLDVNSQQPRMSPELDVLWWAGIIVLMLAIFGGSIWGGWRGRWADRGRAAVAAAAVVGLLAAHAALDQPAPATGAAALLLIVALAAAVGAVAIGWRGLISWPGAVIVAVLAPLLTWHVMSSATTFGGAAAHVTNFSNIWAEDVPGLQQMKWMLGSLAAPLVVTLGLVAGGEGRRMAWSAGGIAVAGSGLYLLLSLSAQADRAEAANEQLTPGAGPLLVVAALAVAWIVRRRV